MYMYAFIVLYVQYVYWSNICVLKMYRSMFTYTNMCTCTYKRRSTCTHTFTHTCTCTCTCTSTCTHTCTWIRMYMHKYVHAHILAHKYTCTYMHMFTHGHVHTLHTLLQAYQLDFSAATASSPGQGEEKASSSSRQCLIYIRICIHTRVNYIICTVI
jgi:carbohydrate-binding DOMON domain-containing protein